MSGPGTVTFAQVGEAVTHATFSAAGTYVLMLTATDGALSSSDTVSVQVTATPVNLAPVVNAGSDRSIVLPSPASLSGSVSDDGLPGGAPTTSWSKVSGPGTVAFAQPAAVTTTATFSAAGTYVLMLAANDGALAGSDTLVVTVSEGGMANNGIGLGGTNAYVTFGAAPGLGAATFTIEAWFRRDGAGSRRVDGQRRRHDRRSARHEGPRRERRQHVDMNYFLGIDSAATCWSPTSRKARAAARRA